MHLIHRLTLIASCAVPALLSAAENTPGLLLRGYFSPVGSSTTDWVRPSTVAGNISTNAIVAPRNAPEETYLGLSNSVVTYENPASNLPAYNALPVTANYSTSHLGTPVMGGNQTVLTQQVAYTASRNPGYIYVAGPNERSGLPAYWEAQIAAVQTLDTVPETEPWAMLLAGLGMIAGIARHRRAPKI